MTGRVITSTGAAAEYMPPDGPARDDLLGLVRLGLKFKAQQQGKRAGFLHTYLESLVSKMLPPVSFDELLAELSFQAARRQTLGVDASPIEKVDKTWEVLTWHDPRKGREQTPFGTIRNHLTKIRKTHTFTVMPKP